MLFRSSFDMNNGHYYRAMLRAFEISVEMLEQRGRSIDVHSRQALEFMQKQLGI